MFDIHFWREMRQNLDNCCKLPLIVYSSSNEIDFMLACQSPEFSDILTIICV